MSYAYVRENLAAKTIKKSMEIVISKAELISIGRINKLKHSNANFFQFLIFIVRVVE